MLREATASAASFGLGQETLEQDLDVAENFPNPFHLLTSMQRDYKLLHGLHLRLSVTPPALENHTTRHRSGLDRKFQFRTLDGLLMYGKV